MIRGFELDTAHDLALDSGGRLTFVSDDAATAQEIKTRLLFFRGESFTDAREGVPYFQEILKKGVSLPRVRAILRQVIQSHPAIVDVPRLDLTLDRGTRIATVVFEARTVRGTTIRSEDYGALEIT